MQRFAGLNSIEGWNLTFQLSNEKNIFSKSQEIIAKKIYFCYTYKSKTGQFVKYVYNVQFC